MALMIRTGLQLRQHLAQHENEIADLREDLQVLRFQIVAGSRSLQHNGECITGHDVQGNVLTLKGLALCNSLQRTRGLIRLFAAECHVVSTGATRCSSI